MKGINPTAVCCRRCR